MYKSLKLKLYLPNTVIMYNCVYLYIITYICNTDSCCIITVTYEVPNQVYVQTLNFQNYYVPFTYTTRVYVMIKFSYNRGSIIHGYNLGNSAYICPMSFEFCFVLGCKFTDADKDGPKLHTLPPLIKEFYHILDSSSTYYLHIF